MIYIPSRTSISLLVVYMLVLSLFLHCTANADDSSENTSVSEAEKGTLSYGTKFTDLEDKNLTSLFKATSKLIALNDRPPHTLAALERRVRTDMDTFEKILRSEGYYDGKVAYRIEAEERPVQIFIDMDAGPRYRLKRYTVEYVGPGSGGLSEQTTKHT